MRKCLWFFLVFWFVSTVYSQEEPLQPYIDSLDNTEEEQAITETTQTPTASEQLPLTVDTQNNLNQTVAENITEETVEAQGEIPAVTIADTTQIEYTRIDLPYTENPLIDKFRKQYLTNFGKQRLAEIMERASVYRPYIREQLGSMDLPVSLEFLPVIESDYKTTAISRSGATGLWQFMENSIEGYLTKNEWLDERRDPWLSTIAAAEKLEYNYSILKNWELALAAYNMGLNGLRRAMNKAGSNDYWYLADNGYIPAQTRDYVPKFIAVADLITNAEYYDINIPPYNENDGAKFVEIPVEKQVNLSLLASLTDIDYSTLQFLNPSFEYAISPPSNFTLRIPVGSEEIIHEAIESQDNSSFLESYIVVQGDTLWSLSRRYNTSVEVLCEINNRTQNQILSIGTILFLPILK